MTLDPRKCHEASPRIEHHTSIRPPFEYMKDTCSQEQRGDRHQHGDEEEEVFIHKLDEFGSLTRASFRYQNYEVRIGMRNKLLMAIILSHGERYLLMGF
jgi:hypothetical protein